MINIHLVQRRHHKGYLLIQASNCITIDDFISGLISLYFHCQKKNRNYRQNQGHDNASNVYRTDSVSTDLHGSGMRVEQPDNPPPKEENKHKKAKWLEREGGEDIVQVSPG